MGLTAKKFAVVIIVLVALAGLFVKGASAQNRPDLQNGDFLSTEPGDFWPQTLSGSNFYEYWTYQFFLDDGLQVTLVFTVANIPVRSAVSGFRLSITGFEGNTYQMLREYPIDLLVLDRENGIFRPNPDRDVWIEGIPPDNQTVHLRTSKDDIDYDLTLSLSDIQQGIKPRGGSFTLNGRDIGMLTHIPYANVNGSISINGDSRNVSGTAYMDHTYQDQISSRILSDGYRYVQHNGPTDWSAGYFLSSDSNDPRQVIGYEIGRNDDQVTGKSVFGMSRMNYSDAFDYELPSAIQILFADNTMRAVRRVRDREKFALFQDLSGVARFSVRTLLGGEIVEFRGEAEFESGEGSQSPVHYYYFLID